MANKISIKDRIDGNELDLSLNQLTEVPVSDLASAVKATHIDLSCNKIKVLPNNFSTLTHLVKIDLSKNQLVELPSNFGNLVNLQYLDLYDNQIAMLPISFCRLKNLKWLDLKKNPLDPKLKAIAGDCLDQKQCQLCAKNVVAFMKNVESEMERQKQKRLKEERMKEAERLEKEAKELAEQRKKKKEEREKKRAEAQAKSKAKKSDDQKDVKFKPKGEVSESSEEDESPGSWLKTFVKIVFSIFLFFLTSLTCYAVMTRNMKADNVSELPTALRESYVEFQNAFIVWWKAFALPYFLSLKENVAQWVQTAF